MTSKVYIVARSRGEANAYADEQGLKRGEFTVVMDPGQVRSARRGEIHLLPGWEKHPKRHALRAALRFARAEVVEVTAPDEVPADETVEDARGDLTERQLEVAYRYNALRDAADIEQRQVDALERGMPTNLVAVIGQPVSSEDGEETREAEPSEDPAPTEEPKARRRSKCKTCGELHYRDEPCPTED